MEEAQEHSIRPKRRLLKPSATLTPYRVPRSRVTLDCEESGASSLSQQIQTSTEKSLRH